MALDPDFLKSIAPNVVARYRAFIFGSENKGQGAKQVNGEGYPDYADGGLQKSLGTGKLQSREFAKSALTSRAPVYSGLLMKDFQGWKTIKNGFKFGTPTRGGVVESLRSQGRVISSKSQPLPDVVEDYIMEQANKNSKKWWRKRGGNKDVKIKIDL